MQRLLGVCALVFSTLLAGCAAPPAQRPVADLLHDELFSPPRHPVDAGSLFALSPEMRHHIDARFAVGETRDPRRRLLDALYRDPQLRLRYDPSVTRTAAEAYAAGAGNCLSLVLMTAAFAKHLGLPVGYRRVLVDALYSRDAGIEFASGHVNLVLAPSSRAFGHAEPQQEMVVDFLPPQDMKGQRSVPLEEATIVAMYLNNRAAEALPGGDLDQAYAWARAAVLRDPRHAASFNTLAVVYLRAGHRAPAEAALRRALALDGDAVAPLANLVALLEGAGRGAEAAPLAARLAALQPQAPFAAFDQGRAAMDRGDYVAARELFRRELRLQPEQADVHFWAARASWALGDAGRAAHHLRQAQAHSPNGEHRTRYAAKLERLRDANVHN